MKAGKLRHAIYILAYTDARDIRGDRIRTFEDIPPAYDPALQTQPATYRPIDDYASIEPLVGRELIFARGIRADISHKITMRYRADIHEQSVLAWVQSDNPYIAYKFQLAPEINAELRAVEMSFYAYVIR